MTLFEESILQKLYNHWSTETSFAHEPREYIDYCREVFIESFTHNNYVLLHEFYVVKKYGINLSTAILEFINNFETELEISNTKPEQISSYIIKCSIDPFWKRTPVALSLLTYLLRYGHDNNFDGTVNGFVGKYSDAARFVMNEYLTKGVNTFNRYSSNRSGIAVATRNRQKLI